MYIEPNSNIRLLTNVPLDKKYENTLYFSNVTQQNNYFLNKTKHTLTNQTYQRVQRGVCRVERSADLCYDCNYMMFQNTSHGSKWFYAFITKVEYISNVVCEIYFEIDVMQTWLFNFTLNECFVEREHSVTDNIGDNIISEPIDLGDIICGSMVGTGKFDSYTAVVATAYNPNGQSGGYVSGLFTGLHYVSGLIDNNEQVQQLLDYLESATEANKVDSITSIFVIPTKFYTNGATPVVEVTRVAKNNDIKGYVPRNNKLLTYPFNYLSVDCGNNSAVYRYEYFFNTPTCDFSMNGCVSPNPEIQLVPVNYNGAEFNYGEKLVMSGFPQVAYSVDAYKAWLAQESTSHAISGVASVGGLITSLASGNYVGATLSTVGLAQNINSYVLATNRPPQARGNGGGTVSVATRTKDFWFKHMHVTPQYARVIDNYFDMYGYATNMVKQPNISSRPHWNYVKTSNCTIRGGVPSDDGYDICNIFNKGITFWKNGDEVGNYSLDNRPL